MTTLTRENGVTKIKILQNADVNELIKTHEAEEAKIEAEKKQKEKEKSERS